MTSCAEGVDIQATVREVATRLRLPLTIDTKTMRRTRIFARRLDPFKDQFCGRRCFIVGNGPSLAKTPLHKLIGECTFAMNRIALIFDKTDWRPTFYTLVTVGMHDPTWATSVPEVVRLGTPSFVWWPLLPYVGDYPQISTNVYPVDCSQAKTDTNAVPPDKWWSWDIGERISKHGTSMLAALQIAVFMGFNPIYLIGADNYWKPFDYETDIDPNHFDSSYWGKMKLGAKEVHVNEEIAHRYTHQCTTAHELAYRVTAPWGINIYNATIGGKLEVYERVDIYDLLR